MACWEVNTYKVALSAANIDVLEAGLLASAAHDQVKRNGDSISFYDRTSYLYGTITGGEMTLVGRSEGAAVAVANRVNVAYAHRAIKVAAARAGFTLEASKKKAGGFVMRKRVRA
jgi:hypothetical protein